MDTKRFKNMLINSKRISFICFLVFLGGSISMPGGYFRPFFNVLNAGQEIKSDLICNCEPQKFDSVANNFSKSFSSTNEKSSFSVKLSESSRGTVRKVNAPNVNNRKVVFLTFDACGQGGLSDGYDSLLVDYLISENITSSFFISKKWALKNGQRLDFLVKNGKNIKIYNHGSEHIPISTRGDSIYGIVGTNGLRAIFNEVENSAIFLCNKLGYRPKYFRPGTVYSDELGVKFIEKMNYITIGYSVLGDAGATFSSQMVYRSIIGSKNGDIILFHFNHPESQTRLGIEKAINELKTSDKVIFGDLSAYEQYFHYEK